MRVQDTREYQERVQPAVLTLHASPFSHRLVHKRSKTDTSSKTSPHKIQRPANLTEFHNNYQAKTSEEHLRSLKKPSNKSQSSQNPNSDHTAVQPQAKLKPQTIVRREDCSLGQPNRHGEDSALYTDTLQEFLATVQMRIAVEVSTHFFKLQSEFVTQNQF